MPHSDTPRCVLYLGLSDDSDASTAIERQREDLHALAEREHWQITVELVDNDISGGVERDNARLALDMLRDGRADVLAVWKLDRFGRRGARDVADLADVIDARAKSDRPALFVTYHGGIRSDVDMWETLAALSAGQAKQERLNTSLRVKSSRQKLPKLGRFPGGVRPFGYDSAPNPDGAGRVLVVNGYEAGIIHEIEDRVFAGESFNSIATDLNKRGVPTTRSPFRHARQSGKPTDGLTTGTWTTNLLQLLMTSDHLLGRMTVHGKLLTDSDGVPVRLWPEILDWATLTRLRQRTRSPRARAAVIALEKARAKANGEEHPLVVRAEQRRRRASRLLSGVVYCAHCDAKMFVSTSNGTPVYACMRRSDPNCTGPRMTAANVERVVEERFLAMVGSLPEVEIVEHVSDPGTAEALAEVEAAITGTSAQFADEDADRASLLSQLDRLQARRTELRAIPATVSTISRPTGRTYGEAWHAQKSVEARRALLLLALDHVTVSALSPDLPRKGFHPERVAFFWNGSQD